MCRRDTIVVAVGNQFPAKPGQGNIGFAGITLGIGS